MSALALALAIVAVTTLAPPSMAEVKVEGNTVTFRLYAPDAKSVHLAGTFNNWSTTATPMQGPDANGYWTVTLTLANGRYEYKFVVDGGKWLEDPQGMDRAPDGFGGFNSVVYVGVQPPARLSMDVSGELILKLEQVGERAPINNYNDLILTLDGSVHPYLDAYGKIKLYKGFTPVETIRDLDWAPNYMGLEEGSATLKAGPVRVIGSWKVHAGDAGDPWGLFQANKDEDDFWKDSGYYRTELVVSAGDAGSRLGFVRGKDRVIFAHLWAPLGGLKVGAVGTYHTWQEASRADNEDHNLVYGAYVDGNVTPALGLTAEWLRSKGTKLVVTEGEPSEVTFTFVMDPHALSVALLGSWDNWAAEIPMTKDPTTGYWNVKLTLAPGVYEYVFHAKNYKGEDVWYNAGNGENMVRHATSDTEVFTFADVPETVTQVWLRGNMPGVGWDPGVPMTKTPEGYWSATVSGLTPGTDYLWKVFYKEDGKDTWRGQGESGKNFKKQVGSGLTEQPKQGDAVWAEVRFNPGPLGVKLGTKQVQPEFNAEFSAIGKDAREYYGVLTHAVTPALKLETGYSWRTNYAGQKDTRTDTITPAIELTKPAPWLESARLAYAYKQGADPVDELTFKAALTPVGDLRIETEEKYKENKWWSASLKFTGTLPGKLELSYERDPSLGRKANVWWERGLFGGLTAKLGYNIEPGKKDNIHAELVQKLSLATSPEVSLAHDTRDRKTTFQVKLSF